MDIKAIKNNLKEVNKKFAEICSATNRAADSEIRANLKPGEAVPQLRYDTWPDTIRANFAQEVRKLRDKALATLDAAIAEAQEMHAEAPSSDAVNAVAMLRDMDNVTESDVNAMLSVYGDNYLSYVAIRGIAEKHKIYGIEPHLLGDLEEGLSTLRRLYERDLSPYNAGASAAHSFTQALMDTTVDANLPG